VPCSLADSTSTFQPGPGFSRLSYSGWSHSGTTSTTLPNTSICLSKNNEHWKQKGRRAEMADVGTHSMNGAAWGIVAVNLYPATITMTKVFPYVNVPQWKLVVAVTLITGLVSFLWHLLVADTIPHGHTGLNNRRIELKWDGIATAVVVSILLVLAITKGGGLYLLLVSGFSIFCGDIFDVILTVVEERKNEAGFRNICWRVNYLCHWFTKKYWPGISKEEPESFQQWRIRKHRLGIIVRNKTIYGWQWGWYGYFTIVCLGIVPLGLVVWYYYYY